MDNLKKMVADFCRPREPAELGIYKKENKKAV